LQKFAGISTISNYFPIPQGIPLHCTLFILVLRCHQLYAKEGGTDREKYSDLWVTKALVPQIYCHSSIAAGFTSVSSYLKPISERALPVEVVLMAVCAVTGPGVYQRSC